MNTNGQKKYGVYDCVVLALQNIDKRKAYVWYVSIMISIIGIILAIKLKNDYNTVSYCIALLSGVIICSFVLYLFINISINEKCSCKTRMSFSFLVNCIFSYAPTWLINNYHKENNQYVHVLSIIGLILLITISYYSIKIERGNDISLLKASNLFIAFLFTAIKLLIDLKKIFEGENYSKGDIIIIELKKILIDYHYLLPLIGLRGLYDLFDGKIKRKNNKDFIKASKGTINEIQ
jgi:hypothetical protein